MFGEIQRRLFLWDTFRTVQKHGYTAIYISGEDGPSFGYSVGYRESLGSPEIIMFGFPPEYVNGLVGEAFQQLKAGKLRLADNARWELEDMPALAWRAVHPSQIRRDHFNVAMIRAEKLGRAASDLSAFQLFAPDPGGRFPWEDGFDMDYEPRQPELYVPYRGPPDRD